MNDTLTVDTSPSTNSTSLDTAPVAATQNGGGQAQEPKQERPETVADSIRSVIKDHDEKATKAEEAKADKTDAKPEVKSEPKAEEAKAERSRGENGKFAKADGNAQTAEANQGVAEKPASERAEPDDKRASEARKYSEPPARFLPEGRAKWMNTPNEVKAEVHRVAQEYEQQAQQTKATVERYETIRQFDEQARANGRELKDSLAKMVQIEQSLARNPVMGLEMILREVGPRKPDGSPVSLHDIAQHVARLTPQQYAQNMGALQQQGQPQQRQAQVDPKVAQLEQKVAMMEGRLAEQAANPIIERFSAAHPDYHSLEQQIAIVLKSGIIENIHGTGLTPEQKLEQAYRIAGGQGPSSHPASTQQAPASVPPRDRPVDPAGQKSITGALNSRGDDPDDSDDAETDDIRTMLRKGMRRAV